MIRRSFLYFVLIIVLGCVFFQIDFMNDVCSYLCVLEFSGVLKVAKTVENRPFRTFGTTKIAKLTRVYRDSYPYWVGTAKHLRTNLLPKKMIILQIAFSTTLLQSSCLRIPAGAHSCLLVMMEQSPLHMEMRIMTRDLLVETIMSGTLMYWESRIRVFR